MFYSEYNPPPENMRAEVKKLLKKADKNKDGCYTRDELKEAFKNLGSKFPSWRTQFCLWNVDANHDGKVSGDDEINSLIDYIFDRLKNGHYKLKDQVA